MDDPQNGDPKDNIESSSSSSKTPQGPDWPRIRRLYLSAEYGRLLSVHDPPTRLEECSRNYVSKQLEGSVKSEKLTIGVDQPCCRAVEAQSGHS